jgi:hypothetical protein
MIAQLYRPDSTEPEAVEPANGTDFTLKEAQGLVGGYVELIRLDEDHILLVDEDGRRKRLPVNETAAKVANGYPLVGNVLLAHESMFR